MSNGITAIIQARTGSSRLPGKVLKDLCGKPSLVQIYWRLKNSKYISNIVIATTTEETDDPIEEICKKERIYCFRGSENDVLDRFYQCIRQLGLSDQDIILRITGDCPLIDPFVVDRTVEFFLNEKADYVSNALEPTFPDGLDTEVIKVSAIKRAWHNAKLKYEREHVTQYILKNPGIFRVASLKNDIDYSDKRWTMDEPEDYNLIKTIYDNLYEDGKIFTMDDVLRFLKSHPELEDINKRFSRNEGLEKSIREESI